MFYTTIYHQGQSIRKQLKYYLLLMVYFRMGAFPFPEINSPAKKKGSFWSILLKNCAIKHCFHIMHAVLYFIGLTIVGKDKCINYLRKRQIMFRDTFLFYSLIITDSQLKSKIFTILLGRISKFYVYFVLIWRLLGCIVCIC